MPQPFGGHRREPQPVDAFGLYSLWLCRPHALWVTHLSLAELEVFWYVSVTGKQLLSALCCLLPYRVGVDLTFIRVHLHWAWQYYGGCHVVTPPPYPPAHIPKKANVKSPIRSTLCRSLGSLINSWITRILLSWRWVRLFIKMSSDLYRERLTKDYALISEMNSFNALPVQSGAVLCEHHCDALHWKLQFGEMRRTNRWTDKESQGLRGGEAGRNANVKWLWLLTFTLKKWGFWGVFFYDSILKHFYKISVGVKVDCVGHQTFQEHFTSWLGPCPHVHGYF